MEEVGGKGRGEREREKSIGKRLHFRLLIVVRIDLVLVRVILAVAEQESFVHS